MIDTIIAGFLGGIGSQTSAWILKRAHKAFKKRIRK